MTYESKQAQALLRAFETLGVPLIGAVDELLAWQASSDGYASEDAAKNFAALLSASIATGTQLANRLAPATQEEAEKARLAASGIAAHVIAQHYVLSGQLPDDGFNRRLTTAFEGVLSLADSFAVAAPEDDLSESDIISARIEAMTPFVQAVLRFPFGLEDSAVIRKMGERLCDKATALADAFSGGQDSSPELFMRRELAFLKGCAKLMARSCEIEMDRMQQALSQGQITQAPAPEILFEHIFRRFEGGLDVLRAVIGFASGPLMDKGAGSASATSPKQAAPKQAANPAPAGDPSNPMSFFVKKDTSASGASGEAA